jgi:hypothetical protein
MPIAAVKTVTEWKQQFNAWSNGPSDTETQKCNNAERMVREAIAAHAAFSNLNIETFAQGSYRNRTNVRFESDVDVCVVLKDAMYTDYELAPGLSDQQLGFKSSSYTLPWFKNEVQLALNSKFGEKNVKRGKKAIEVIENSYRIHTDAVPSFEGRLYQKDNLGQITYRSGTVIWDDATGESTKNYPHEHIEEGEKKHTRTSRRYKKRVRILKNLCIDMKDSGIDSATKLPSFLLESLAFNCPDNIFNDFQDHFDGMRAIIAHLWTLTKTDESANKMVEANNVKFMFRKQAWKRLDVHQFLLDAWQYIGFD